MAATDSVSMFREVYETNSFICLTESLQLFILKLSDIEMLTQFKVELQRPVFDMMVWQRFLVVGFTSGDSEVFWIGDRDQIVGLEKFERMVSGKFSFIFTIKEFQLIRLKLPKETEHEGKLKLMALNH
jgi:hypothetical protein